MPNPVANLTISPATVTIPFPSPREDAPEVPVGKVAVPQTVQKPPSPRRDAPETLVGLLSVPKTGQKPPSPHRDASETPLGKVPVPKTGQKPPAPRAATESKILNLSITIFKIFMAYPFGKS